MIAGTAFLKHFVRAQAMTDFSGTCTVYERPEGESTQWEDIQRKLGNLPHAEPVWKPEAYKPEEETKKVLHHLCFVSGI